MAPLLGAIPFFTPWEHTIGNVPIIGEITLQLFGPLVVFGIWLGIRFGLYYAKQKDLDEFLVRDQIFWVLIFGFIISHWISVIFYFPEKIVADPPRSFLTIFNIFNGISSVGGFFGAFIGMNWFLRRKNQPVLVYADTNIFSLLIGMVFGRMGCSVVHDHPGRIVDADTFLAVGPWKCRCAQGAAELYQTTCCSAAGDIYRYDLGLIECLFLILLSLFAYFVFDWRNARPGKLCGVISIGYGIVRFILDFFRASSSAAGVHTTDLRYFGLTPAQFFSLAFIGAGVWLLFIRKPKPNDLDWAKDSERIAAEQVAREGSASHSQNESENESSPSAS